MAIIMGGLDVEVVCFVCLTKYPFISSPDELGDKVGVDVLHSFGFPFSDDSLIVMTRELSSQVAMSSPCDIHI